MTIYNENFKPTWLYIKQHGVTGKLYFGKTCKKDPIKYLGSGSYWKNHIKKYGVEHVKTLWCHLFFDEESIKEFAIWFSHEHKIVESKQWANILIEDGLTSCNHKDMIMVKYPGTEKYFKVHCSDERWINGLVVGANKNRPLTEATKEKISISVRISCNTPEFKLKASVQNSGKNNSMYGKIKDKHWRYIKFNAEDIKNHLISGKSLNEIAILYNCTPKCIRCRIFNETGLHFRQWRDLLISSEGISSSQFYKSRD
jgi:hypothetical protein